MTTLYLTPGDDFTYTAAVTDEGGNAYPLTGCTLWFTAKRRRSDADANALAKLYWVSGGASSGITVAAPSSGEAVVTIAAAVTDDFVQAAYYWDLQLEDAPGVVRSVDSGILVVLPGVTTRLTTP